VDSEPDVEGSVIVVLDIPQSGKGHTKVAEILTSIYQVFVVPCCIPLVETLCKSPPVRNKAQCSVDFFFDFALVFEIYSYAILPILLLSSKVAENNHAHLDGSYC